MQNSFLFSLLVNTWHLIYLVNWVSHKTMWIYR